MKGVGDNIGYCRPLRTAIDRYF